MREIWLLRLRALVARARRDETAYRDFTDRYHDMAKRLASRGISRGPRRCHDDIRSLPFYLGRRLIST